jgi:hypothetical protein
MPSFPEIQLIPGKWNSYKTNPSRGYPISDIPKSTEILRYNTPPHDTYMQQRRSTM